MSRVFILILSLCAISALASDCVGSFCNWKPCSDCPCGGKGTQSRFYEIQIPAEGAGKACPHPAGFEEKRPCDRTCTENNCKGEWTVGPCVSAGKCGKSEGTATRTYKITTPAGPGGAECPVANGATEAVPCSATIVPCKGCVGDFGPFSECVSDNRCGENAGHRTRTFKVTQQAEVGGSACLHADGFVERSRCATATIVPCANCEGAWSEYEECKLSSSQCNSPAGKRKRTYFITKQAGVGGQPCPHTNGFEEVSDCLCKASQVVPCVDGKGAWGEWGTCQSKNVCGSSAGTRTRTYKITQQPGPGGAPCPSKDGEVETGDCAASVRPCAGCEGSWGEWSSCKTGVCGSDKGKRKRTFTVTKAGEEGGAKCEASNGFVQEECCKADITPCAPEACVGSFGAVSACKATKSCGSCEGTQSRTFTVTSEAKHGGALCAHPNGFVETLECRVEPGAVKPCPVDGQGDFGAPSECVSKGVCGEDWGTQTQVYKINVQPAHGGKPCPYKDGFVKKSNCKAPITPCPPRDCVGSWSTGPCKQNKCGEAAGECTETFKITTSSAYGGKCCEARNGATRIKLCEVGTVQPCPVQCVGEFSEFGPCESAGVCSSCKGSRKRTFKVSQKAAHGGKECSFKDGHVDVDHTCSAPVTPCPPEDCEGSWKSRDCVAASCGTTVGLQNQTFVITKTEKYGGKCCAFKHHEKRTVSCVADHYHCPIKCVGAFSEFSECKAKHKCGSTSGIKTRTYAITTECKYGGEACPRADKQVESEDCQVPLVPCPPEDCIGSWSEPTKCVQKECGKAAGTQKSTYTVKSVAKHGGQECPAKDGEVKDVACNIVADKVKQCPVDCVEQWTAWEKCVPLDCGCTAGEQKRSFKIITPAAHGGKECKFADGSSHVQACEADVLDVKRCPNHLLDEPCEDVEALVKQAKESRCKLEAILSALTATAEKK